MKTVALLLACLLTACGGGGSIEEPSENTPKADCVAKPEACR